MKSNWTEELKGKISRNGLGGPKGNGDLASWRGGQCTTWAERLGKRMVVMESWKRGRASTERSNHQGNGRKERLRMTARHPVTKSRSRRGQAREKEKKKKMIKKRKKMKMKKRHTLK